MRCCFSLIAGFTFLLSGLSFAQNTDAPASDTVMSFEAYDPPSTLVVPGRNVYRAKFPFVDVHNHQWRMPEQDLAALTAIMDTLNMAVMVNLSGRSGDFLANAANNVKTNAPNRILLFANIDFRTIDDEDWTERTVAQLRQDHKNGAVGLKIYKNLGLTAKDTSGNRIPVDDPRIGPVWDVCGELGMPVLIHSGEPAAFWLPKDGNNERWLEMKQRPRRWRGGGDYPSWEHIIGEQHRVFRKHSNTTFINAHLGWMGNDLARLGDSLKALPNVYTEIGAVLAELGRQPRFAKQWFIDNQDRVLFGKDSWRPDEYATYFRVLETNDEYFPYYRKRHAFWKMYGLDLPDDVLKKLYYQNALRIFPTIDRSLFPD